MNAGLRGAASCLSIRESDGREAEEVDNQGHQQTQHAPCRLIQTAFPLVLGECGDDSSALICWAN